MKWHQLLIISILVATALTIGFQGIGGGQGHGNFVAAELIIEDYSGSGGDLAKLADKLANALIIIAIPIAVIMIIVAGIMYLTSGGDKGRVSTANRMLLWTLVGLAIIFIGKGFVYLVQDIIGLGT
jgi:hypothetical protein